MSSPDDPASVYQPSPYSYPPPPPPGGMHVYPAEPPPVVIWFKLYAGFLALWNLLLVPMGVLALVAPFLIDEPEAIVPLMLVGLMWIVMGVFLALVFALPIFLKPRPWVWIYSVVLIAFTMTSVCCMPAAIPLIIFWVREDNRNWYGMR